MDDSGTRPSYEPAELPEAPPAATPQLSSLHRLVKAFYSPGEVFEDIRVKPTWVAVLLAMMVLTVGAQAIVLPHMDQEATIRDRLGERSDELTDEQIENIVEQSAKFTRFLPVITAVIVPVMWAILAAIFFLALKMVGSETDYVRTLSAALHAYWPPAVVATVLLVVLIQGAGKVTEQEIPNLVKSHLGAFLPPDAPGWLSAAASTLSVFNVWTVVLLVIGFRIVGRLSTAKAATAVLVPWAVWLVAKAGLGALQGMFS
ncbi:MAG TPA: Yip1 family protein [Methylomirabilota bacterium]|nr:Yip1 family protein [Methylomirabilota bacterium]